MNRLQITAKIFGIEFGDFLFHPFRCFVTCPMEQLDAITIKHVKESFAGTFSNQNLFVDAPVRSLKAALFSLAEFVD